MNIVKQIDSIAKKFPNRVAYDYLGQENTYQNLKDYSDSLASHLDQMDLTADSPIMVYADQTFFSIAAFLAVAKTGHAYIPVDQHSPNERLEMINEIANPGAIIAVNELPIELPGKTIITPTQLKEIFMHQQEYEVTHPVSGDQNFYIIFTSGTTGQPKGVQISHDNLRSFVDWMLSDFYDERPLVTLAQAAYSFDLSVMDLYPTLLRGGKLAALPKEVTDNFKELFQQLPKLGMNIWVSTPSFVEICLLDRNFNHENYPNLDTFLFCGEELTHKTAALLKERFPIARVINTYGPTEATVAITSIEITPEILAKYDRLPIGYPQKDVTVEIKQLDEDDQNGEIIIGGIPVSKGYINNPEKTKVAFFDDPKHKYRSGDLGFLNEEGLLFYRGRTDFQIKLNGYRIELEDINFHLNHQAQIKQGVAIPKYDRQHRVKSLIAYVVLNDDQTESETDLTLKLKEQLESEMMSYMVPQRFIYQKQLPLSPNGKVDIKELIREANGND